MTTPQRGLAEYNLAFASLFYEWSQLKIHRKATRMGIWVDNDLLTDCPSNVPNAGLVSLTRHSKGPAMYHNVRISNSSTGHSISADDFNTLLKGINN